VRLLTLIHRSWIASTLKMEAIRSSETSVKKPTRRHIPEHGILQCGNVFNLTISFTEILEALYSEEM
jgi:hypothetical protein